MTQAAASTSRSTAPGFAIPVTTTVGERLLSGITLDISVENVTLNQGGSR